MQILKFCDTQNQNAWNYSENFMIAECYSGKNLLIETLTQERKPIVLIKCKHENQDWLNLIFFCFSDHQDSNAEKNLPQQSSLNKMWLIEKLMEEVNSMVDEKKLCEYRDLPCLLALFDNGDFVGIQRRYQKE